MRPTRLLSSLLVVALLAGCHAAGPVGATTARQGAAAALSAEQALTADERETLEQVLQSIGPAFADGVTPPPTPGKDIGPKAGLLYRALAKNLVMRMAAAKLAEGPVHRHFSKPGTADQVPPLSATERAELDALLKPGDVIQCGNDGSFVHAIFYEGEGMIVHALAQTGFGKKMIGVRREKLAEYLDRSDRDKVVVLRPRWTPETLETAIAYARAQVGKDYDPLFMTDADDRHYCTELVWAVLTRTGVARVEPHLAGKVHWRVVTNEDIRKSADLTVVWRRNHD